MADKGRPLPKFGEWDVNNPASAEGFTVIFNNARDEKKSSTSSSATAADRRNNVKSAGGYHHPVNFQYPRKSRRKWFCCA